MSNGSVIFFDRKENDGFLQIALSEYAASKAKIKCGIPELAWPKIILMIYLIVLILLFIFITNNFRTNGCIALLPQ